MANSNNNSRAERNFPKFGIMLDHIKGQLLIVILMVISSLS